MKLLGSVIVVAMAGITSGCIEEPTGKNRALAGRYSLSVVAGKPLPLLTYSAMFGQAKREVIGAEFVAVSSSRMLDIVEYQVTNESGVKQTPFKDTVEVTYELVGSALTITRPRGSAAPAVENWEIAEGVLSGVKAFKNTVGTTEPYPVYYTIVD